jgi:hypothetical protein
MRTPHVASGGRYPVLRAIGIIYVVMAGLSIIVGLIAAGYIMASQPWSMTTRVVWAIVSLAGTCFAVIGSLAVAEVLKLFMDIEHNTRMITMRGATDTSAAAPTVAGPNGPEAAHVNRMREMDEETAEGALLRGH